jgi:dipeptidase E
MDGAPPERRRAAVQLEIDALATIGLTAVELDLRLGDPSRVTERLAAFAALWLRGGNAFVLRAGLAATGADAAIVELLRGDQLVYAGYSAGPCVAGPTLRGLEAVDDVSEVRPTYGCEPVWDGRPGSARSAAGAARGVARTPRDRGLHTVVAGMGRGRRQPLGSTRRPGAGC